MAPEAIDELIERAWRRGASSRRGAAPATAIDARAAGAPAELMRALAEDMRNAPERRLRGSMRSMIDGAAGRAGEEPADAGAAGRRRRRRADPGRRRCWRPGPSTRPARASHFWHGVGHSPNLDCPAELAALIRRFIEVTIPAPRDGRGRSLTRQRKHPCPSATSPSSSGACARAPTIARWRWRWRSWRRRA